MKLARNQRETALREYAQELGCSLSLSYTSDAKHLEEEIVRRIQASMRSIRESRMWWIAFISAIHLCLVRWLRGLLYGKISF